MKSHEVLKAATKDPGPKSIAHDMKLSTPLIYKWMQDEYHEGASPNPLDRVVELHKLTKDDNIIRWVCGQAGGFFVKNIEAKGEHSTALIESTQKILKEFSDLLKTITDSSQDGIITKKEAELMRKEWEDMKSVTEELVVAAENGGYKGEGNL